MMREDNRFEIERALDLLPHVTGGSWAMVWFRLKGIRNPTSEEFRDKVIEFFLTLSPLLESFKTDDSLNEISQQCNHLCVVLNHTKWPKHQYLIQETYNLIEKLLNMPELA